jgi:hypothetical protein
MALATSCVSSMPYRGTNTKVGCHGFRATGITNYLRHDGTLARAQQMGAHASPRTTKLYDRTNDQVSLGEVERIRLQMKYYVNIDIKKCRPPREFGRPLLPARS